MKSMILLSCLACWPTIAHADALDGDWCSAEGKLTIDGKTITTPAGRQVEGIYSRHRFRYTAPQGGWKGGNDIRIRQYSDTLMVLKAGDAPETEWRPCQNLS